MNKLINIAIPPLGITIGVSLAALILFKINNFVIVYQVNPKLAFLGLNAAGFIITYLGYKFIKHDALKSKSSGGMDAEA
ncbi:hypothetical protein ES703_82653 [subsurface metagenome]